MTCIDEAELVGLLESLYALDREDEEWLSGLLSALAKLCGPRHHYLGYFYDASNVYDFKIWNACWYNAGPEVLEGFQSFKTLTNADFVRATLRSLYVGSARRTAITHLEPLLAEREAAGWGDIYNINGLDPSGGTFGPCMGAIAPGQTDCSTSADENCDGTPDNTQCGECTLSATQYCYDGPEGTLGVGPCMQGTQVCELDESGQGAVWGPCAGQITPASSDSCDLGNDATCNDVANENCLCINGDTGSCGSKLQLLGNCAAGSTQCVNGTWSACSVAPKPNDGCDSGDDATCNGQANEGCICLNTQTRSCGTSGTGCTLGTETCQGGNWGSCQNNVCQDFSVTPPSTRCSVTGPNGEDAEVTCSIGVCSSGYYVTDCSLHVVSGSGSCSFVGPSITDGARADVTATKNVSGTSVVCGFSACTCRRNGF